MLFAVSELICLVSLELDQLQDFISFSHTSYKIRFSLQSPSLRRSWFDRHGQHQLHAVKTANLLRLPLTPDFIDRHLRSFFSVYHHIACEIGELRSPLVGHHRQQLSSKLVVAGSKCPSTEIEMLLVFCWTHLIPEYIFNILTARSRGDSFDDRLLQQLDLWFFNFENRIGGAPFQDNQKIWSKLMINQTEIISRIDVKFKKTINKASLDLFYNDFPLSNQRNLAKHLKALIGVSFNI